MFKTGIILLISDVTVDLTLAIALDPKYQTIKTTENDKGANKNEEIQCTDQNK